MAYVEALNKMPVVFLLDRLLHGTQVIAPLVHAVLLVWIAFTGIRLRKSMTDNFEQGSPSPSGPSLLANFLLIFVGLLVGFLWTRFWCFLADAVGLRGRMTDVKLVGLIVLLSAAAVIACHLVYWRRWRWWRWRWWWGLTAGIFAGLALSFFALTT